ncbi:MAG TPA: FliM/FliN family flagellar motor switch protein [Steroidobacteraceae bacterium]|nr:FliM/FliN family flagellar motor switch protein [Steroidobacteraceae bacterium]
MSASAHLKEEIKNDGGEEVHLLKLTELKAGDISGKRLIGENLDLIRNLKVRLSVVVGRCEITVKELFDLRENTVLTLDRDTREPVEITLDGKVVARGVLVAVEDSFGVRITEINPA